MQPDVVASTDDERQARESASLLEVDGLSIELRLRHRVVHAVNDVSLTIGAGETVGLVGESGSGKTMFSLTVMRLLPQSGVITSGKVRFRDTDLLRLGTREMRQIRGNRISMVFQEPMTSLDPLFTIGSQLTEAVRAHESVSATVARERAAVMLERVEIPAARSRLDAYPHELSGGMRQRVMIAMALALGPDLLLADEPTTALDVTVQAQILDLIAELQTELGMGVLLVTHNLAVVREVADRVAVMYAGEIVETAPSEQLFANPRHPYTLGLLRSIPSRRSRRRPLHVIAGGPPALTSRPTACPFHLRCPNVIARCTTTHPALAGENDHLFRCFNPASTGARTP
jgi:oligopeptide/dipeptide ABC transporter ATP-binding protein